MADIRINALATTATTPASDDYLALDGAAQGTRKILATNIANNVTDVILGTSGPSVKSSLSARAPRQGLVFDGTAGATGTAVTIGTADLTFSQWVRVPSTVSATRGLFLFSPAGSIGATSLLGYVDSDATLNIHITGATSGDRTKQTLSGFVTSYAGKWVNILFTRVGSTWTGYINGVATTFSASTSGTAPTWAGSISGAVVNFGSLGSSGAIYNDAISAINIYNRALSASEVVALYEAGAPAGADYNSAGQTISNATWTNGSSPFSSFSSASGAAVSGTSSGFATAGSTIAAVGAGKRVRVSLSLTLTSGQAPQVYLATNANQGPGTALSNTVTLSAGSNVVELVSTNSSAASLNIAVTAATNFSITSVAVVGSGLLLAPDAAQAGGGLVWYDTSGNAANITLPASGVSWNVPSSQKTATGWTFGGKSAINVSSTYNNDNLYGLSVGDSSNVNKAVRVGFDAAVNIGFVQSANFGTQYLPLSIQVNGGNALFGTPTDSGNGRIQLATHTTSAGGIGFGTDTSLYRTVLGQLALNAASGGYASLGLYSAGSSQGQLATAGNQIYLDSGANLYLRTNGSTTALTLDSSQNATFNGGTVTLGDYAGDQDVIIAAQSTGVGYLRWRPTASGTNAYGFSIGYDNPNNKLSFLRHEFSTAGTEWLSVARATGDATFAGKVKAPKTYTANATVTVAAGATATLFAPTNGVTQVLAYVDYYDPTNWSATATVTKATNQSILRIVASNTPGIALSVSGSNLQVTNNAGGPLDIIYVYQVMSQI